MPNLIGADKAVSVIVENSLSQNRMLKPKEVLDLGIADAMFEPADFIEQSLYWAVGVLRGDHQVDRMAAGEELVHHGRHRIGLSCTTARLSAAANVTHSR